MSDLVITSNKLFAAEEWEVVFNAFREVNINPYDYSTISNSLVEYIKANNPEEYRRYTNNGLFTAHIELFSRLAHSLSYRYEKSTRENFFDSVENRESAIELAKIFSYQPKRNRTSNGLCKISAIRTTEPVYDSNQTLLANNTIKWNHEGDPNWYEKYIRILNAALSPTNPVGKPMERRYIYGVRNELYPINRLSTSTLAPKFKGKINGRSYTFEGVGTMIKEIILESTPDPYNAFNLLYKNDSNGNFSPDTGFFVQFKQGSIQNETFTFTKPEKNKEINLNVSNINETDVWVCEIYDDGLIKKEWTKIDSMEGQNLVYEKEFNNNSSIYTVTSRPNNQVTIKFGDGINGNIPYGNFRIWYRTSENERYIIRRHDIQSVPITIPYVGNDGGTYQLTLYLTNEYDIDNAEPEETLEKIKRNAPLSHYTQERMINGEDYNVYPLIQTSLILKTKTVNRTHYGHTRYMDIYDNSNTLSKITLHASDGFIYADGTEYLQRVEVGDGIDYVKEVMRSATTTLQQKAFQSSMYSSILEKGIPTSGTIRWRTLPRESTFYDRGYFTVNGKFSTVGETAIARELKILSKDSQFYFNDDEPNTFDHIENNGLVNPNTASVGSIKLSNYQQDGSILTAILPDIDVKQYKYEDFEEFGKLLEDKEDFELYFRVYDNSFTTDKDKDDAIFLQSYQYISDPINSFYRVQSPTLTYIVGSDGDIEFFQKDLDSKVKDPITGYSVQDYVGIGAGNVGIGDNDPTFLMRRDKTKDITIMNNGGS